MPENPRDFKTPLYGLKTYGDLFTPRQLVALTTFSDLVQEARERVKRDAIASRLPDDGKALAKAALARAAYADAVGVYLAFAVDKLLIATRTGQRLGLASPSKTSDSGTRLRGKRFR
jgi:putative DNA methylase